MCVCVCVCVCVVCVVYAPGMRPKSLRVWHSGPVLLAWESLAFYVRCNCLEGADELARATLVTRNLFMATYKKGDSAMHDSPGKEISK